MNLRNPASNVFLLLITFLSLFLLAGCSGGGGGGTTTTDDTTTSTAKYTVMVYMVGSDLESGGNAGTTDLAEMMQVGSTDNLKVIVTTGGANKDGWRTVKRRLINQGSETEISDLGNLNMGQPATLQDFIEWAVENYPADKYALIMWDHGAGAIGGEPYNIVFGNDENNNDGLSLPEIRQALQSAYATTGKKFDLIGCDACLMATLETASIMSSFGNDLVASEELEPGHGWDYAAILSAIKSNSDISGAVLGQTIADSYKSHAQTESPSSAPEITLSVIDLSKVSNVINRLESLATAAGTNIQNSGQTAWSTIADGRSKAEDYGGEAETDMADLKHIAQNITTAYPTEANALIAAIDQAVLYKIKGAARPNSNGLSIFLPNKNINNPGLADMITAYDNLDFSQTYEDFVSEYSDVGGQDDTAPAFANESLSGDVYSAEVQGDDVDTVYAVITQGDPTSGTIEIIGMVAVEEDVDGNVSYTWDGQWVTMNDNYVSLILDDEDDEITTYTIPALLNGEEVNILVMIENDTGDYSILGAWPGMENGVAAREILPIEEGDEITPLFISYDLNTDEETYVEGEPFVVGLAGIDLSSSDLPTGTYQLSFIAEDYAQNEESSQFVEMTVP